MLWKRPGINTRFENCVQQSLIVMRITTELWTEHLHTIELEFEKIRDL